MVTGLTTLWAEILLMAPQASFRLSTFRLQQRLDINPTAESLDAYYQMLLAEMEHLTLSPESASQSATVKALNASMTSPNKNTTKGTGKTEKNNICKNWGSDNGCKMEKNCRYLHPQLPDQKERCWTCSGTQQRKSECPHKPVNQDPGQNPKGQGKQNGQTDRRGPGDGRGKKGSKGSSTSDINGNNKEAAKPILQRKETKVRVQHRRQLQPTTRQQLMRRERHTKIQGARPMEKLDLILTLWWARWHLSFDPCVWVPHKSVLFVSKDWTATIPKLRYLMVVQHIACVRCTMRGSGHAQENARWHWLQVLLRSGWYPTPMCWSQGTKTHRGSSLFGNIGTHGHQHQLGSRQNYNDTGWRYEVTSVAWRRVSGCRWCSWSGADEWDRESESQSSRNDEGFRRWKYGAWNSTMWWRSCKNCNGDSNTFSSSTTEVSCKDPGRGWNCAGHEQSAF